MNRILSCFLLALGGVLCLLGECWGEVSFRTHVAPILLNRCYTCHNAETAEGGYSVATFQSLLEAGDSDETPVRAGASKFESSELLRRLVTADVGERMPLDADPLPDDEIDLVRRWIREGAEFDGGDQSALLSSILPITQHPAPPQEYPHPVPLTAIAVARVDAASTGTLESDFVGESQLYVGGYHELIMLADNAERTSILQRIQQTGERVYDVAVTGNDPLGGERIYVASGTPGKLGELRVFTSAGELIGVPLTTTEAMFTLAMTNTTSQNSWLAVAGGDRSIYLVDMRSNSVAKRYGSHSDWVRALCWSDDGTKLASASRDKTVKLFDPNADQPVDTYSGHQADVVDVVFVPGTSDRLVSCDAQGGVYFWSAPGTGKAKSFKAKLKATHAFALATDQDGVWVSSGVLRGRSVKYSLTKLDWSGKKVLKTYELPTRGLSVSSSNSQGVIWVGLMDGRLWRSSEHGNVVFDVLP